MTNNKISKKTILIKNLLHKFKIESNKINNHNSNSNNNNNYHLNSKL